MENTCEEGVIETQRGLGTCCRRVFVVAAVPAANGRVQGSVGTLRVLAKVMKLKL